MVKALIFLFFFAVTMPLEVTVDIPAQVSVELAQENALENQPIPVIISIIREARQKIDEKSFKLGDQPLVVQLIDDIGPPANVLFHANDPTRLITSKYRAYLAARKAGMYQIDPVSVQVGDVLASSVPKNFEVIAAVQSQAFRLEAKIIGEKGLSHFYPGQKLTFQYRIFFQDLMELFKEDLPLLNMPGFRNIGAPKITTVMQNLETVQIIDQNTRARIAGTFRSSPSLIEGRVYTQDQLGKRIYTGPLLRAVAPSVEVTVLPFPEQNKPIFFNGALGVLSLNAQLLSSAVTTLEEKLQLQITITGKGDLDTVIMPDLQQQNGFRDSFSFSAIAPIGEIINESKRFIVELQPLSLAVDAIPEIEFASLNPIDGQYHVTHSDPIPLIVQSQETDEDESEDKVFENRSEMISTIPQELIQIEPNQPLDEKDLVAPQISQWLIIVVVLISIIVILFQIVVKKLMAGWLKKGEHKTSRQLFLRALQCRNQPNEALQLITKALLVRLYEIGETPTEVTNPSALIEGKGIQGEIREFLILVEEKRFSGQMSALGADMEVKEFIEEAIKFHHRLQDVPKHVGSVIKSAVKSIIFLLCVLIPMQLPAVESVSFDSAFAKYREGEQAETVEVRKQAFNEALSLYLHVETQDSSGLLYYNIANCYFQLGENGLAILYYYRARDLLPRNKSITHNLQIALNKVEEESSLKKYIFPKSTFAKNVVDYIFFFQHLFSFEEIEIALLGGILFTFCFCSLCIWLPYPVFRFFTIFALTLTIVLGVQLMWIQFFVPLQAVIIRPAVLRSSNGTEYAPVVTPLIMSGLKVQVLEVRDNGAWVKVELPSGEEGFIDKEQIRII